MTTTTTRQGVDAVAGAEQAAALHRVLQDRAVRTHFQPVVELAGRRTVAYEALSRGPEGSVLESPAELFRTAAQTGRLEDLDRLCREQALAQAQVVGIADPLALFVNVEPAALSAAGSSAPWAPAGLRVVLEVTERDLTARPAELLALVERVRSWGWGVALDDVGADPRSLALMPVISPEIIKLDLALVQRQPGLATAEIVAAVQAEAERSGSLVLAEGIETEQHAALAREMGAVLGQGWLFGRPAPLTTPPVPDGPRLRWPVRRAGPAHGRSVFDLAAAVRPVQRSTKPLLIAISTHLEDQALAAGTSALTLGAFEDVAYFTGRTRGRYERLAGATSFVGALGRGVPVSPGAGVRGADLADHDPVVGEWDVAVLGPHFAAALVARDLGDERGPGREQRRRFDYVLTYDRDLVVLVARALMTRMSRDAAVAGTAPVPTARTATRASRAAP